MFLGLSSTCTFRKFVPKNLSLALSVCGLLLIQSWAVAGHSLVQQPATGAQSVQEGTMLESAVPLERELTGGQKHTYQVLLSEGQFLRIEIKQHGINVAATLHLPDGKTIPVLESFGTTQERSFELIAESFNLQP